MKIIQKAIMSLHTSGAVSGVPIMADRYENPPSGYIVFHIFPAPPAYGFGAYYETINVQFDIYIRGKVSDLPLLNIFENLIKTYDNAQATVDQRTVSFARQSAIKLMEESGVRRYSVNYRLIA